MSYLSWHIILLQLILITIVINVTIFQYLHLYTHIFFCIHSLATVAKMSAKAGASITYCL